MKISKSVPLGFWIQMSAKILGSTTN